MGRKARTRAPGWALLIPSVRRSGDRHDHRHDIATLSALTATAPPLGRVPGRLLADLCRLLWRWTWRCRPGAVRGAMGGCPTTCLSSCPTSCSTTCLPSCSTSCLHRSGRAGEIAAQGRWSRGAVGTDYFPVAPPCRPLRAAGHTLSPALGRPLSRAPGLLLGLLLGRAGHRPGTPRTPRSAP